MRGHICELSVLLIAFFSWRFALTDADERGRQTFVVRYKNGEQTIPVTVVLDHKKQTEYVINMHPRSQAKSVTLYDFKQRTIAFKDLTNRECFLGHLTHETLNHEREALHEVKSPVDMNPKILSLDPRRPALTPTEIRNIAGQKTAVFCRKMNTWLLMPDTAHNVKKRDVEEVEERTYGHHGYHTVQYSHYGHETIRRYRNPSRSFARHQHHRSQNAAENENLKPSASDSLSPLKRHSVPHHKSNGFQFINNHGTNHHVNPKNANDNSYNRKTNVLENSPNFLSATLHGNSKDDSHSAHKSASGNENFNSFPTNLQNSSKGSPNVNTHFGYRIKSPTNFEAEFSSSFIDKSHISNILGPTFHPAIDFKSEKEEHPSHLPGPNEKVELINKAQSETSKRTIEEEPTTEVSKFIRRTERDSGVVSIPTAPYLLEKENDHFGLLPKSSSSRYVPNAQYRSLSIHSLPSNQKSGEHGTRQIETESFSEEILPPLDNNTFKEPVMKYENTDPLPTPWNVSTDDLKVPKEANKFETLKLSEGSFISNQKPDIHVGGLLDSLSNQPVLEDAYFFNPYNHENGISGNRNNLINSDTPDVGLLHKFQRYDDRAGAYLNENHPRSSFPTHPTELPTLRTPIYEELKPDPTSNFQSYTTSIRKPANSGSKMDASHLVPNPRQDTNFNSHGPSESAVSPINYAVYGNTFSEENLFGIVPRDFETTESYSLVQETKPHLRSDIPSEDANNDGIVGRRSFNSVDRDHIRNSDPSQNSNNTNKNTLTHQARFQNVLRHFKPDEIIIDVARIPTQPPPDTTQSIHFESTTTHIPRKLTTTQTPYRNIVAAHSSFKSVTTTQIPLRSFFTNRNSNTPGRRSEQVAGATYRTNYDAQTTRQPKQRINNHSQHQFPPGVTFHVRKNAASQHHRFNDSQQNIHPQAINRHRQRMPPAQPNPAFNVPLSNQYHFPQSLNHLPFNPSHRVNQHHEVPLPQIIKDLNNLPPGVSMHPRHPQSPFANMIHSNRPPPLPQGTDLRVPPKPHRQRHHRKKERLPNSCCRVNGKLNGLQSCCRSGGHCCSGQRNGRQQHPRGTSCCSSNKTIPNRQMLPRNHHEQPIRNNNHSQQTSKMFVDNRDRCQKEKMCRTVYESTQQVMVCRQADIEGC